MDDTGAPDVSIPAALDERTATDALLSTGDMARLSESTLRTVRFYEEEGLVTPTTRGVGGQRYFTRGELEKLRLALDLREAGLSLSDIKELFALKSGCASAKQASERMTETLTRQLDDMQRKIAKLRRLREELSSMVSVIAECRDCAVDQVFPVRCRTCEVVTEPEKPRALRVLWNE